MRKEVLEDLALKFLYLSGPLSLLELSKHMRLSFRVTDELFHRLRAEHHCEVTGMSANLPNIAITSQGEIASIGVVVEEPVPRGAVPDPWKAMNNKFVTERPPCGSASARCRTRLCSSCAGQQDPGGARNSTTTLHSELPLRTDRGRKDRDCRKHYRECLPRTRFGYRLWWKSTVKSLLSTTLRFTRVLCNLCPGIATGVGCSAIEQSAVLVGGEVDDRDAGPAIQSEYEILYGPGNK